MKYKIISAETDLGLSLDGTDEGAKILSEKFINLKRSRVVKKNIIKDKNSDNLCKNIDAINEYEIKLFNEVYDTINDGYFPITIGGDHSIAVASALASYNIHKSMGIIWIDAHTDYNTLETTETGNIHGLPLAVINGHNKEQLSAFLTNKYIKPENTVIVGARSIDKLELENLKNNNICVFTTDDIKREGVNEIMNKAFKVALNNTDGVHVSFDLDIIDPEDCPGVSVPVINGISKQEAFQIIDNIVSIKDKVRSFDLVEYNPRFDDYNKTLEIGISIIEKIIK